MFTQLWIEGNNVHRGIKMFKTTEKTLEDPKLADNNLGNISARKLQDKRDEDQVLGLVENLPFIFYRCNCLKKWSLEYISAGSIDISGYNPDELLKIVRREYFSLMDASDKEAVYLDITKGIEKNGKYATAYKLKTADGDYKVVNDRGKGIFSSDGTLVAIEGIISDLNERKPGSTDQYQNNNGQRKDAMPGIPAIVLKISSDSLGINYLEYVSEGVENLLFISEKELNASPGRWLDAVHIDDIDRLRHDISYSNKTLSPLLIEFRVVHRSVAEQKWLRLTGTVKQNQRAGLNCTYSIIDISEIKKIQQRVKLMEERYSFAVKATNDAIYDYDIKSGEIYWGETFETVFGYSREQQITTIRDWADLIHIDEAEIVVKSLDKAMQFQEEYWSEEFRFQCKNGTYKHVQDQGYIIYENGRAIRMIGAMKDISRNKADEEKIKRSNNLLKSIHFATNIMLRERFSDSTIATMLQSVGMSLDVERAYIVHNGINENGAFVMGRKHEWINSRVVANCKTSNFSDFYSSFLKEWGNWLSEGMLIKGNSEEFSDPIRNELEMQKVKSIILAPIQCHGAFWGFIGFEEFKNDRKWSTSEEHAIVALANTLGGIVEKQKTQEELKTSLAILSASLEATADGIVVTGLDREIINVNEKFFRIFNIPVVGSRVDSVPFVHHYMVKHVHEFDLFNEKLEAIYATPELPSFDLLSFRNGRWVERFSQPLYINGECNGLVWSYRDVTQNQKDGADLLEKNKELEKTNAELDRFVYSVSHELRAPLLSILGLVNIAEAETTEAEVKQYCNLMRTSVDRLDGFIQNIIYYSQNSRSTLNRELIIFEKLAQEAFNTMKYVDSKVSINTDITIHQDFPFYSDKTSLNVILSNLVTNAAKFRNASENAEPRVEIDIRVDKAGACITVSDNGLGIAGQYHGRLFDMFFRVSGKQGGSGLGLYVVKEIIEKLNGRIWVESEEGIGSKFIIELPHNNGR